MIPAAIANWARLDQVPDADSDLDEVFAGYG